jgi:hypothetical protein
MSPKIEDPHGARFIGGPWDGDSAFDSHGHFVYVAGDGGVYMRVGLDYRWVPDKRGESEDDI